MSNFPQRVACLQPSATSIVAALGLLDRVVACTKYCVDVCPEAARGRMIVADSWSAKADEILATKPDLVIASVPYQEKALGEILKAGVRFLGCAPRTLADIYGDIAATAGILGVSERGEQVIGELQREIAAVTAQVSRENPHTCQKRADAGHPGATRPRVYCEEWGKPLIHSQRWVAELVEAAGGEFIGSPAKQTTAEEVRQLNPEVIIAAWCGAGDRVPLEKIVAERGWTEVAAARAGRVFCIRDELLNTPAPTLVGGLHALARAIHPEIFPTADGIRAIANSVF